MKKIRTIKVWTDGFDTVNQKIEDLLVLYEFFEAKEASEEETDLAYNETIEIVENLEAKNMLRNEEDRLGSRGTPFDEIELNSRRFDGPGTLGWFRTGIGRLLHGRAPYDDGADLSRRAARIEGAVAARKQQKYVVLTNNDLFL